MSNINFKVFHDQGKFKFFIDVNDSVEVINHNTAGKRGEISNNSISLDPENMPMPHEISIVENVFSILEGEALDQSIQQLIADQNLNEVREVRNSKLAATDWWMVPDRTATDEQIAYRQALRDITDTYTSLEDVVWPEKPE